MTASTSISSASRLPWPTGQETAALAQVVGMMAWAARHDRPLDSAVQSLVAGRSPTPFWELLLGIVRHPTPWSALYVLLTRIGDEPRIRRVAAALHRGQPPEDALTAGFGRSVPQHLLLAIKTAAPAGLLPQVLDHAHRQVQSHASLDFQICRFCDLLLLYIVPISTITSGLSIFILPKFSKIAVEMSNGAYVPHELGSVGPISQGAALLIAFWLPPSFFLASRFVPSLMIYAPGIGRIARTRARQLASQAIHLALCAGKDLPAALALAEQSADTHWARSRLARAACRLDGGEPIHLIWRKAGLAGALDHCLLGVAALAQDPARGFAQIDQIAQIRLQRQLRMFSGSATTVAVLVAGILVGGVGVTFFHALVTIIRAWI